MSGVAGSIYHRDLWIPATRKPNQVRTQLKYSGQWLLSPKIHAEITIILASSVLRDITRLMLDSVTARDMSLQSEMNEGN